jgi:hypothetical protein
MPRRPQHLTIAPRREVTFYNPDIGFCVLRVKARASVTWSRW